MKILCQNCGREFEPKTHIKVRERFGEPKQEIEVEDEICPDCKIDLGLEEENV